jgi:hypothetical protein
MARAESTQDRGAARLAAGPEIISGPAAGCSLGGGGAVFHPGPGRSRCPAEATQRAA